MGSEKFSLRWNDFESTISCSLGEIKAAGELLDVSLACGGDVVRAHRLVVSACSPLLRNILSRAPAQANPFIYLKGVQFEDLVACLDFMYHGEVSVAQESLNSFLAAAEELQVRGLTQDVTNKKETTKKDRNQQIPNQTPKVITENVPIKPEPKEPPAEAEKALTDYIGSEEYEEDDYTDYDTDHLDYQLQTRDAATHDKGGGFPGVY